MNIFAQVITLFNPIIMVLILAGGIASTRFLMKWNWTDAWKTLIVGTFFTVGYLCIKVADKTFRMEDLESYFVTYCITTSLYELILKHFMIWIQNQFNFSSKTGSDGSQA